MQTGCSLDIRARFPGSFIVPVRRPPVGILRAETNVKEVVPNDLQTVREMGVTDGCLACIRIYNETCPPVGVVGSRSS